MAFGKKAVGKKVFGKEVFGKEAFGKEVTVAKRTDISFVKSIRLCWALYSATWSKTSSRKLLELSYDTLPSELASFFSQHAPNLRRCTAKFTSTVAAYFLCGPRGTVAPSEKPNARGPAVIGCLPSLGGNREGRRADIALADSYKERRTP